MRVAQSEIAKQADVVPEALSTAKLFPCVAAASVHVVHVRLALLEVVELNPHAQLRLPSIDRFAFATTPLAGLLVHRVGPVNCR